MQIASCKFVSKFHINLPCLNFDICKVQSKLTSYFLKLNQLNLHGNELDITLWTCYIIENFTRCLEMLWISTTPKKLLWKNSKLLLNMFVFQFQNGRPDNHSILSSDLCPRHLSFLEDSSPCTCCSLSNTDIKEVGIYTLYATAIWNPLKMVLLWLIQQR